MASKIMPVAMRTEVLLVCLVYILCDLSLALKIGACQIVHAILLRLELHDSRINIENVHLVHIILLIYVFLQLCNQVDGALASIRGCCEGAGVVRKLHVDVREALLI